ncbi:Putative heavy-metal chelation [Humidesulfovibrio mexicanus]|uniref:Putative heavy-metal chelation n=1 Tax=Humidesulfovibrio mexicanus TaxID=147047 RepID=A0A239A1B6_9BACT|nr:DUF364 domain-containing protein [Humidesulfovibrio mexicanus]SNR89340.1 Putative heavy-metal chelation [Humidesulfovibrio mexicanus]
MERSLFEQVRSRAVEQWRKAGLLQEPVRIAARVLSAEEAIGNPGEGFKLQTGRERMMEAEFHGARGQAFTDQFGDFVGTLADIADMPLSNNYRRAVFVATLNATMRSLGLCDRTVHCRDQGPSECAEHLREHLLTRIGPKARITLVGLQPKFVAALAKDFELRVLDLDPDNIGKQVSGVCIEGPEQERDAVSWAQQLVVTGSTLTNGTLGNFLGGPPATIFGVTAAGADALMGWDRFCAKSD